MIDDYDDAFQVELEMDRRSWLWRRKSSEKSPAETDSSGSFSSHSERFSDDQTYAAINNPQSPEVTFKALTDDETNDDVKTLTNELSAALLNISAKENLLKQHAKVAEEAVSGWEKAEKELLTLKQQLEAATKKKIELEDRVVHLDAALRECVRQLRQAREEQEQKINEAVARKTQEWESIKSELETKIVELHAELQIARSESAASVDSDLQQKLEAVENENSSLKCELLSQAEEMEIRIMEQDLSTQVAETASKQHLESIKKVAKLEAECQRLKTIARKVCPATDLKSLTASSICIESFTDSQSDSGERLLLAENDGRKISGLEMNEHGTSCSNLRASALITEFDQFKNQKDIGRNLMVPSLEIDLMDDFLEMEKLAALTDTETGTSSVEAGHIPEQDNGVENPWKDELKAMIHRTAELEDSLKILEEEKIETQKALSVCQRQMQMSQTQLRGADAKLVELQAQLALANEAKQVIEEEIQSTKAKREVAESQLLIAKAENKILLSEVSSLNAEVQKERSLSAETLVNSQKLEEELSKMKRQAELQHEAERRRIASSNEELKIKQEKELAVAASKFAECQITISSLGCQLKSLAIMEDFLLDSDKSLDLIGNRLHCHTNDEGWSLQVDSESLNVVGNSLSKSKNGGDKDLPLALSHCA